MTSPYSLRVHDLRTDRLLGYLPIGGVTFDDYIGKSGSLSGTLPAPNAQMAARIQDILQEGRTLVDLVRGGTIVWSGIVWTATPTADERDNYTCPIQGATLESYYRDHLQLRDADLTYTSTDQLAIARALIGYAATRTGGDLGIEMDTSQTSGVLRDRAYSRFDQPYVGRLLDDLAAVDNGFEWRINRYQDAAGARHRVLRLGYPRISIGTTDLPLKKPGLITAHSIPRDATAMATCWQSRGSNSNSNQAAATTPLLSTTLTDTAAITAGWPLLDGSSDYSTVTDPATLNAHAQADLARFARPVAIPQISVLTGSIPQPELGSYIRVSIRDAWYPTGHNARYRVVGLRCTPAERGRPDMTQLYLEAA
ncbi:hypothetical protein [Kitasatospora cheerisanensis]|uniref:Uncharacterized protein n=1 Tax=Kitasatospora cheerisanensis KCTC 2395 TaxID=1348663 RepID=A0A066YZG5_9ACTN|nr:hypothetical protein [Kitasatospora cheerisanensis]KDN83481.1 hypothetical protein KCH_49630 [Kitasatospora cheerisanensis KCTC 2395]